MLTGFKMIFISHKCYEDQPAQSRRVNDLSLGDRTWYKYMGLPTIVTAISPGGLRKNIRFQPDQLFTIEEGFLHIPESVYSFKINKEDTEKLTKNKEKFDRNTDTVYRNF